MKKVTRSSGCWWLQGPWKDSGKRVCSHPHMRSSFLHCGISKHPSAKPSNLQRIYLKQEVIICVLKAILVMVDGYTFEDRIGET